MFNVENFTFSWEKKDRLTGVLNNIGGDNYVNPIRNSDGVSKDFRKLFIPGSFLPWFQLDGNYHFDR